MRGAIARRLRQRHDEITAVIFSRIDAVSPLPPLGSDEYADSLRLAVPAAVEYAISALEEGADGRPPPVPPALLVQARLAARSRIGLDSVLRRYIAGHAVLTHVAMEEAERHRDSSSGPTSGVARPLAALLDHIAEAVSEEHRRESATLVPTSDRRELESIRRLLGGELLYRDRFAYDFGGLHLAVVASGSEAEGAIRALAKSVDSQLLLVRPSDACAWGWLGLKGGVDWLAVERFARKEWPGSVSLAVGEQGQGIVGWQTSHQQARAAAVVAEREPGTLVRYGPNNFRISALTNELVGKSLRDMYLEPLRSARAASALQETLRTYLAAGRNAASTAAALGVSRRTVSNRVQIAEKLLGSQMTACSGALEVALWLEEIERVPDPQIGMPSAPDN